MCVLSIDCSVRTWSRDTMHGWFGPLQTVVQITNFENMARRLGKFSMALAETYRTLTHSGDQMQSECGGGCCCRIVSRVKKHQNTPSEQTSWTMMKVSWRWPLLLLFKFRYDCIKWNNSIVLHHRENPKHIKVAAFSVPLDGVCLIRGGRSQRPVKLSAKHNGIPVPVSSDGTSVYWKKSADVFIMAFQSSPRCDRI